MNDKDYFRFIHDLYEFNDQDRVNTTSRYFNQMNDIGCRNTERKKRKLLVDIHVFCLMPNHYHLLLSPRVADGIPRFMKKMNMGYAKYFNQKYERTGALFQGRYKSVLVKSESHFIHLPYYIHLNPLDLITPGWREKKLSNPWSAINFLNNYRWSSFLDYIGKTNFPSVTMRKFLSDFLGGPKKYKLNMVDWLKDMDCKDKEILSVVLE